MSSESHDKVVAKAIRLPTENYSVEKEIGKGSFAVVYKGLSLRDGRNIAIKAVSRSKLKNKKLLENLEVEIAILKKIKHPHIVGLIDCERTSSDFYLIMEYCALGDLTFFIKKRKNLVLKHPLIKTVFEHYPPPSTEHNGLNRVLVVNYLQQLSSALKFLRSKNLVHRDIKPQNLLLCTPLLDYSDPKTFHELGFVGIYNLPILKIADFGFARFLPNTSLAETLCGSPLYMAPEILNYQKYNAKADLWSVGTVLYEMCCGRPPFKASNHLELFQKIKKANDEITVPSNCYIEPKLFNLIRGLLTFDPDSRMGFTDFFNNEVVTEDLTRYEQSYEPDLESKSKDVAESNMFVSEYLVKPLKQQESAHIPPSHTDENTSVQTGVRRTTGKERVATNHQPHQQIHPEDSTQNPEQSYQSASQKRLKSSYNDLILEKEYVVVEKKTVEVNSLADDFANNGPITNNQGAQVIRPLRYRTSSSSDGSGGRRASLVERRLSISSLSPSNALSKALGLASVRLFGYQHNTKATSSPPQQTLLNPQIFHELTENAVLRADHKLNPFSEQMLDSNITPAVESLAAKAFVMYSFAEMKFSQILPTPPSSTDYDPLSDKRLSNGSCAIEDEEDLDQGRPPSNHTLTSATTKISSATNVDTQIPAPELKKLCTESLLLYLKALTILAASMKLTSKWWYENESKNCTLKLNILVQWIRDRFNECLDKAEFLRLKLHAINTSPNSQWSDDDTIIFVEKLIYDRALDISRNAARMEMESGNYNTCELAYATSLWMLEILLDENFQFNEVYDDEYASNITSLDESDKEMIKKYISSIANRLKALKSKMV
ncbi:Atg1 [Kluyveromyces lactis]|nr:Atg1 [Kluyveromyces lactis]